MLDTRSISALARIANALDRRALTTLGSRIDSFLSRATQGTLARLHQAAPALLSQVQAIYDQWDEDPEEYAGGGICHLFAEAMAEVVSRLPGLTAVTESETMDVHVYVVVQGPDGIFRLDIPPSVYETGYGYNWKKIPDVRFEAGDLVIEQLDRDPSKMSHYVSDWTDEPVEAGWQAGLTKQAAMDLASALASYTSKAAIKAVRALVQSLEISDDQILERLKQLADFVKNSLGSTDIDDKFKGVAAIWLKNWGMKKVAKNLLGQESGASPAEIIHTLEKFFLYNQYLPAGQRDLLKYETVSAVLDAVSVGSEAAEVAANSNKFRGSAYNKKVQEGLQKLGENDDWIVWAPHNVEASCHIGAGTSWCTASRGDRNYFTTYYDPKDQLYVFVNKKDPELKYQFHYGTNSFKDSEDHDVKDYDPAVPHMKALLGRLTGHLDASHQVGIVNLNNKIDKLRTEKKFEEADQLANKTVLEMYGELERPTDSTAKDLARRKTAARKIIYFIGDNPVAAISLGSERLEYIFISSGDDGLSRHLSSALLRSGNMTKKSSVEAFKLLMNTATFKADRVSIQASIRLISRSEMLKEYPEWISIGNQLVSMIGPDHAKGPYHNSLMNEFNLAKG